MIASHDSQPPPAPGGAREKSDVVKCVIWDLDHTIWDGILLENENVKLRPFVKEAVHALDSRGILQSVASRNDQEAAFAKLADLGLLSYFVQPRIAWSAKSASIKEIAGALGLSLGSMLFIDDDEYERAEVAYQHPEVRCEPAVDIASLLNNPLLNPSVITEDARERRKRYQAEEQRKAAEASYSGPSESFLQTLNLACRVYPATEQDLARAEELTLRTHQLNSTGYVYSMDDLRSLLHSNKHFLYMLDAEDRFGSYGTVGVVLMETGERSWTIKLLLVSCRVLSRGVGGLLINVLLRAARARDMALSAEFIPTDRNRPMMIAFRFAGFYAVPGSNEKCQLLVHNMKDIPGPPDYISLNVCSGLLPVSR